MAEWVIPSSTGRVVQPNELSLGFNNTTAPEMEVVGLRDVFLAAPPLSFQQHHEPIIPSDPATGLGVLPLLAPSNMNVEEANVMTSRNREIQLYNDGFGFGFGFGSNSAGNKKPRLITRANSHTSTSNTPSRSFDTTSTHPDVSNKGRKLPDQVRAPAVFKCVRVTAMEGGGNEYAYQAVVRIGGHVFKGYLYDHGIDPRDRIIPTSSAFHHVEEGGAAGGSGGGGGVGGASTSSPVIHPANVYPSSGGGVSYGYESRIIARSMDFRGRAGRNICC